MNIVKIEQGLIGVGLYTPAEASGLLDIPAGKLTRWLRGYEVAGRRYPPLWPSQIDLGDDRLYLGFRDLMEARVADAFMRWGLSPQGVRAAIVRAREMIGDVRPLSTASFRTDGRSVFLEIADSDAGDSKLIDLVKGQWTFRSVVAPTLKHVEFGPDHVPHRWWPKGRGGRIVVDPARAFGQPIDGETGVPASILSNAAIAEGSAEAAARAWDVPVSAIRKAIEFQAELSQRKAA
jgi:uncharacterized protein (DUF433 family)